MNRKLNFFVIALGFLTNGVYAQNICDFYLNKVVYLYKFIDYEDIPSQDSDEFIRSKKQTFHAKAKNPTIRCDLNLIRSKNDNKFKTPYIYDLNKYKSSRYSILLNEKWGSSYNFDKLSRIIIYPHKRELEVIENDGSKEKLPLPLDSESIFKQAKKEKVDIEINNSVEKNLTDNLPICKTIWDKGNLFYTVSLGRDFPKLSTKIFQFNDKKGNQINLSKDSYYEYFDENYPKSYPAGILINITNFSEIERRYGNPVQGKCNTKKIAGFNNCKNGVCQKNFKYGYVRGKYSINNDFNSIAIVENSYFFFNKKKIDIKGSF